MSRFVRSIYNTLKEIKHTRFQSTVTLTVVVKQWPTTTTLGLAIQNQWFIRGQGSTDRLSLPNVPGSNETHI